MVSVDYLRIGRGAFPTARCRPAKNGTRPALWALETNTDSRIKAQPISGDGEINRRLTGIMASNGSFKSIGLEVKAGGFLDGQASPETYRAWAGELAGQTRDVVAVVNRIQVSEGPVWKPAPAFDVIRHGAQQTVRALPEIGLSPIILVRSVAGAQTVAVAIAGLLPSG
jgi:hypothetical protein